MCLFGLMIIGVFGISVVIVLSSIHNGGDPGIATRGWAVLAQEGAQGQRMAVIQEWHRNAVLRGENLGLPAFPPLTPEDPGVHASMSWTGTANKKSGPGASEPNLAFTTTLVKENATQEHADAILLALPR